MCVCAFKKKKIGRIKGLKDLLAVWFWGCVLVYP